MPGPRMPMAVMARKIASNTKDHAGIGGRLTRGPPAHAIDDGVGGDEDRGADGEEQRQPVEPHAAVAQQADHPDARYQHGDADSPNQGEILVHEGPCDGEGEERRCTPGDGIDLAQVARAVASGEEQIIAKVQDARGERIGQAGKRWRREHQQHGQPHETHQRLDQAQGQEPVQLQLDQNVPAGMHDSRGKHCKEDRQFQRMRSSLPA